MAALNTDGIRAYDCQWVKDPPDEPFLNTDGTGGYDCQWVEDPPDDLKCLVCLSVARDPQQHGTDDGCGKVFCQTCVKKCLRMSNSCPNCRKQLTTFKDARVARHINALRIKCTNIGNGCQWVNELGSLEDHLQTCDYTLLPCPNQCKAGNEVVHILRKNLDGHLGNKCPRRQFPCQHCNESGEYEERTTSHLKTCDMVKVECLNEKCQSSIPRCEVSSHRSTCLYEVVSCKYSEVGCGETPLRKDLKTHEEDHQLHLKITTETVLKQSKKVASLEDQISFLVSKLMNTSLSPFKFKITNYLELKRNDEVFYSPPFYTSINGYKMCVCVYANVSDSVDDGDDSVDDSDDSVEGSHVSVFAYLMKGDNDDSLTWPFTGEVTFELLNQQEDKNHHTHTVTFPADDEVSERVVDGERAGNGYGWPQYISHTKLDHDPANNCQYLKDNTLIFHVTVKVPNHKPWLECAV